jgi:pimeloyl-ACP methyl ester carboxylesterase
VEIWPGSLLRTPTGALFVRHLVEVRPYRDPALFVHGLGGDSLDWGYVVGELGDVVDAYALDLPGFGESPPPNDHELSIDAHARAVVDVARAIGRGPVHLIGNSLGGAVATRVAAEHPEVVRSLALISPALPDLRPRLWSWQLTLALLPFVGRPLVETALHDDPERLARRVFSLCYGDPAAVTVAQRDHELELVRRRAELPHTASVYRASLRALVSAYLQPGSRRLWRQAQLIGVPTLVVYGGRDKLVDPRMAARARRTFPHAQVVLLPEAGHVAHLEFPDRAARVLGDFVGGCTPTLAPGMDERRGTVEGSDGALGERAS